jgi:hypothetical protein
MHKPMLASDAVLGCRPRSTVSWSALVSMADGYPRVARPHAPPTVIAASSAHGGALAAWRDADLVAVHVRTTPFHRTHMRSGARTPEELDTLLEDAFVVRDRAAVVDLFEPDGLVAARAMQTARGAAIGPFVADLWAQDLTYLARPAGVLQASDTALIVAERAISVVRRRDAHWRYAISLLRTEPKSNGGTQP